MNITAYQYAKARGISKSAVTKQIRKKNNLPDVVRISKLGRAYVLQVKKDFQLTKINLVAD